MHFSKQMGAAAPECSWVPSPTYILRRAAILDWLRGYQPGRVLEVGCGPGALLRDLSDRGFEGTGVELSDRSRRIARKILTDAAGIRILRHLPEQEKASYDYLLAFEVLEHIEDDGAALREWLGYLKPGGIVFISVPAHRSRWNVTDLFAGHFRRYDKTDLMTLIEQAGLEEVRTGTYGWPISRIFEWLRLRAKKNELRRNGIDPGSVSIGDPEMTKSSGVERDQMTRIFGLYSSLPGRLCFALATRVQKLFYRTSLGISFIVIARKSLEKHDGPE